jgi:apolipoprotein N-acyltransferase
VKAVILASVGGCLSFLAFPPYGPGVLIVPGLALFLWALFEVGSRRQGLWVGFLYGLVFFGGFMWWMGKLDPIALVLIPVQAAFFAGYGWWLSGYTEQSQGKWMVLAVGGWSVMELIRYHFPVGGMEWGAAGYALSDNLFARQPAAMIGTSGLTVVIVVVAAGLALLLARRGGRAALWGGAAAVVVISVPHSWLMVQGVADVGTPVTIVQGSTPCPFERCPPDERLRTYEQHLELTRSLQPGTAGLVVWPEGSTGSTNADPVLNEEIREAIAAEARRLGSRMVIGGDRVLSETDWINANVYFDSDGEILGEYRKQHPVPFGEYIPLRPLFDWIPALERVPRDMIRGDGPVLMGEVGSVISWEGGFSRYALETRRAGAEVIIVNTNTASYGIAPTSDIWIGMTRMRAVELGVPIIHSAVTGKSTVIDIDGSIGSVTEMAEMTVLQDTYRASSLDTLYTATGDLVIYLAAIAGIVTWSNALVSSRYRPTEEE